VSEKISSFQVRSTGSLLDKKLVNKRRVLTEEKLDEIGTRLQHTPLKSLRRLAQETGISKSSAARATKQLKLRPYQATAVHTLKLRDSASRINFCNWFLQSVHDGEVDPYLTSFC
jgi:DNA-binding transcriptional MocR family regulator